MTQVQTKNSIHTFKIVSVSIFCDILFSSKLLISHDFLSNFGVNKHLYIFQDYKLHSPNNVVVFENFKCAY